MRIAAVVAVVLSSLAVSACCGGVKPDGGKGTSGGTPEPAAGPATPVDLATMLKDYKENEVRADGQYKGKFVQITGKANEIKKDFTDSIIVSVGVTGAQFEHPIANCYVGKAQTAQASALAKGAKVTVKGRVDGFVVMNVVMRQCEIL